MGKLTGFLTILLLLIIVTTGGYFYFKSELTYLRLSVPNVTIKEDFKEDIVLEIFDNSNNLIYKRFYQHKKNIPVDYDISLLSYLIEYTLSEGKKFTDTYNVSLWKYLMMDQFDIDLYSLKGQVLNIIALDILKDSEIDGLYGDVLHWYTLDKIKHKYTNDQLTKIYLDNFEYGEKIYGIAAASDYYFSKEVTDLSLLELSYLISMRIIKVADSNSHQMLEKNARKSLRTVYESGLITRERYQKELSRAVVLNYEDEVINYDPGFTNYILKEIAKNPKIDVEDKSLKIHTSYNKSMTALVEQIFSDYMPKNDINKQAVLVIANKDTGTIEAAVGSRYSRSLTNRAFSLRRQPASIFKPIVYLTAFANGVSPTDRIVDRPYTFKAGRTMYKPRNYLSIFHGGILVRSGLVHSLNNATVKLAENTGLGKISKMAELLGMDGRVPAYHAMALGAIPMTPINAAEVFATIGNLGIKQKPQFIQSITYGGKVFDMKEKPHRVVDAASAYQTMYIMQSVTNSGTARGARLIPGTASKTGTTNNYKDAWTVILFGPYVAVAWIGYDDMRSMGDDHAGGKIVAPMLAKLQKKLYPTLQSFSLKKPSSIVLKRVNAYSGKVESSDRGNTYLEALKRSDVERETKLTIPVITAPTPPIPESSDN